MKEQGLKICSTCLKYNCGFTRMMISNKDLKNIKKGRLGAPSWLCVLVVIFKHLTGKPVL